jgi:hypothetical protein
VIGVGVGVEGDPGESDMIPGTWYMVHGKSDMVPGTWYMVHGKSDMVMTMTFTLSSTMTLYMVKVTWYMVHGKNDKKNFSSENGLKRGENAFWGKKFFYPRFAKSDQNFH